MSVLSKFLKAQVFLALGIMVFSCADNRKAEFDMVLCPESGRPIPSVPMYAVDETCTPPVIDGNLNDWNGVTPIILNDSAHAYEGWKDSNDQAVTMYSRWDRKNVYFAFDVSDDSVVVPQVASYDGDGIQIVIDSRNDDTKWLEKDDYNMVVGLSQNGPQIIMISAPWDKPLGIVNLGNIAIRKKDNGKGLVYELALPLQDLLPFSPIAQPIMGVDVAFPDNDGKGFKGGQQWAGNIWGHKNPDKFGDFIFQSAALARGTEMFVSSWSDFGLYDTDTLTAYVGINSAQAATAAVSAHIRGVGSLGKRTLTLQKGANRFAFAWDAKDLGMGKYELVVSSSRDSAILAFTKNTPIALGNAMDALLGSGNQKETEKAKHLIETAREKAFAADLPLIVRFKSTKQGDLCLHIFEPKNQQSGLQRPAIVLFYGGAFSAGTARRFYAHARYFASRGMVAICPEYRIKTIHGTTPLESIKDARSAMRWIRTHASILGIDTGMIAAGGGSAGGYLAANVGMINGVDEETDDTRISCQANAMVLFNPLVAFKEGRFTGDPKAVSPLFQVRKGLPASIIFHGTSDAAIPFAEVKKFADKMKKAGNNCAFYPFQGREHEFYFYIVDGDNKDFRETLYLADSFLTSLGYMKGEPTVKR